MDRQKAIEALEYIKYGNDYKGCRESIAIDMAIAALKEPERILKQLEELRDDPIMHCSEDYWEGHYMAAKEAIAIVRGEEE